MHSDMCNKSATIAAMHAEAAYAGMCPDRCASISPGAIRHVTARGNAREPIHRDDADRRGWLETLAATVARFDWFVLAYCQMGNHYHLLVETPEPNLSRGMRQLNGVYAQRFNRRHRRVGHLFQARFHATLIERGEHLLAVAAYVPRNPVRAGLCREPAHWRWSSYRATVGLEPAYAVAVDRLLAFFAETPDAARPVYRAHVEMPNDETLENKLKATVVLGSHAFARKHGPDTPAREVTRRHWQPVRPTLSELLSPPTDAAISDAYRRFGYTMREIADHLGIHYATVSRRIRRHESATSECKT